jgi:ParB-like chromosome segregation protein Spo0J
LPSGAARIKGGVVPKQTVRPKPLTPHPVAALFPDMPDSDFVALTEDIRDNGVKVPILVRRGLILDGRHRYKACRLLGRPCPSVEWNGKDLWLEVQARNLIRRHLAKDQIYAIQKLAAERFPEIAANIEGARYAALQRKAQARNQPLGQKALSASRDAHRKAAAVIGARLGVSAATVERVDRLARDAPELLVKVADGEVSVKKALRAVAIRRHGPMTTADPERFDLETMVQRVQRQLRTSWDSCPAQHRTALLYGLQSIMREFVVEQSSASIARPETRPSPGASLGASLVTSGTANRTPFTSLRRVAESVGR